MSLPWLSRFRVLKSSGGKKGIRQISQVKLAVDFSTNSLVLVDVTGLSITLQTAASTLLMIAMIGFDNNTANTGNRVSIDLDGTEIARFDMESNVVGLGKAVTAIQMASVIAGSHTVKVRTLVSGGTITILATGGIGSHLIVMEV